jgi:hypothetical protein
MVNANGIIKILPAVGATEPVAHDNKSGNIDRNNKQFFNKSDDPDCHKKFSKGNQKSLRPNTLGAIIGQYKSIVSKKIRIMGLTEFQRQRNYYDRINRTKPELVAIRKYIKENPSIFYIN